MSRISNRPSGLQCARRFEQNTPGFRQVMQNEHHECDIQFSVLDRKFFERTVPKLDVLASGQIAHAPPAAFP